VRRGWGGIGRALWGRGREAARGVGAYGSNRHHFGSRPKCMSRALAFGEGDVGEGELRRSQVG
jgi:hypothetical protein